MDVYSIDVGIMTVIGFLTGAFIGVIGDLFRLFRLGDRILIIQDVFFCLLLSVIITVFLYNTSFGQIRVIPCIAVLFGFVVYRKTIGKLAFFIAEYIKATVCKLIRILFSKITGIVKNIYRRMRTNKMMRLKIKTAGKGYMLLE